MIDYRQYITLEPGKRSGKPCIRGLRVTVYDVLKMLAGNMSISEIIEDFPELTQDDILACLAYASDRERRTITDGAALAPRLVKPFTPLSSDELYER